MKRTNIHLTDKQMQRLRSASKESGLTVAELIRRAIGKFLRSVENAKPK